MKFFGCDIRFSRPRILSVILAAWFSILLAPSAISENAVYKGEVVKCSQTYPGDDKYAAAFLDIGKGTCWQCPKSHPHRTVFPVDRGAACERRAYTKYKRASGPENPTGLLRTDCRSGWFLDIGLGKCYSCGGYNRTTAHVGSAKACSTRVAVSRTSARQAGDSGCPDDQFQHLLSGRCYSCPDGTYRNANTGADPSTFNACTRCGSEGGKPCPVTTLRKSCDDGLEEDFIKGICVPSTSELLRRDAMARIDAMGGELTSTIERAMLQSEDDDLKSGIRAQSSNSSEHAEDTAARSFKPCPKESKDGVRFNTWTLSVLADGKAGIGVGAETGLAVDISQPLGSGRERPVFAFGGVEYSFQLAASGSGGVNYGCWRAQNNGLGGDYHGIVLDAVGVITGGAAAITKNPAVVTKMGPGPSIPIAFWYDVHGHKKALKAWEDGGRQGAKPKKIDGKRDYLGFTVALGAGYGADLTGISYVRGTTGQVTGVFPPPLPGDKVFGSFYTFADNPEARNEFVMGGPNLVRVRGHRVGGQPGAWHIYERKLFAGERNLFIAPNGGQTYKIEADGTLTWRSNRSDGKVIKLEPAG